jgi:hypothetical protein
MGRTNTHRNCFEVNDRTGLGHEWQCIGESAISSSLHQLFGLGEGAANGLFSPPALWTGEMSRNETETQPSAISAFRRLADG